MNMLGRPIGGLPRDVRRIYDPDLNKVRDISVEEAADLVDKGHTFVHFSTPMRSGGEKLNFALVRTGSKNSKINDLPYNVIRDNPGYITRAYDAAYVIRQKFKSRVDGKLDIEDDFRVVGIESNLTSADELLEHLRADALARGDDVEYERVIARELDTDRDFYDPFDLDHLKNTGQLYTSVRDDEVLGKFIGATDKRRHVTKSLADSIQLSQIKAARAGTIDLLVDKLIVNWEKSFADKFGVVHRDKSGRVIGNTVPWNGPIPKGPNFKPEDRAAYDAAVALRDQIKLAAGVDDTAVGRFLQDQMVNIGEYLAGSKYSVNRWLSDKAYALRDVSLINNVKALAFFQLITLKPLRQMILQSNQMSLYLGRDGAAKYFTPGIGRGQLDFAGMWFGMAARSVGEFDRLAPTIAKSIGMSTDEYKEFVKAYAESGLSQAIDSHLWAAVLDVNPNIQGVTLGVRGAAKERTTHTALSLAKWARRIGFDVGEQTQLLTAFLTEKNAWQLANPKIATQWSKPIYRDQIAADARSLSLNMNKLGALGFQKGVASMVFQFMSHATKSAQLITPGTVGFKDATGVFRRRNIPGLSKFTNKHIDDSQKYRMLFTQLGIYGTGGLGLSEAYEHLKGKVEAKTGTSLPSDVDMIVEEGVMGTAVNIGLRAAEGETLLDFRKDRDPDVTDLEVSKSLSPLAGTPFWQYQNPAAKVYQFAFLSNHDISDFFGPGVQTMTRMYEGLKMVPSILGKATYLEDPERFEAAAIQLASSMFLVADDWQKARFEDAIGRYMSQRGNIGFSANSTEILTKLMFGPKSRAENRLGALERSLSGIQGDPRQDPDIGKEISDAAKDHAETVIRSLILAEKGDITTDELENIVNQSAEWNNVIFFGWGYSERELAQFQLEVFRRLADWATDVETSKQDSELSIIKKLSRIYPRASDDERDLMMNRLKAIPPFEGQQELIDGLEEIWE